LQTATNLLQPDYAAKDPHFKLAAARLVDVQAALNDLETAVNTVQAARPEQFAQQFKACTGAINTAKRRAQAALQSKGAAQYGDVSTLLTANETEDRLNKVRSACVQALNRQINDATVGAAGERVEQIQAAMERDFSLIDQTAASKQAESEMSYVKRILNSILYEMNFLSLGPFFMFDVAHLGPADAKLGTRYGIGGGLRFTLVSQVDFNIGYAANPKCFLFLDALQRPAELATSPLGPRLSVIPSKARSLSCSARIVRQFKTIRILPAAQLDNSS